MYFEGKCTAKQLVPSIVQHITEATDEGNNRLWEMVSSNIGVKNETLADNGWVFKSSGATGLDNIIIGFYTVIISIIRNCFDNLFFFEWKLFFFYVSFIFY